MTNQLKKRKFLATALTATMVATAVAPVAGLAAEKSPFPDVPVNSMYADAITAMKDAGIIQGKPNGNFDMGGLIKRAEAAEMIAGLLDLDTGVETNATEFTDVKDNAWYTGAINSLLAKKLINGQTPTLFAPNADITRGELAVLLVRAYGLEDLNVEDVKLPFTDVKDSDWYADSIKALHSEGLITGQTATKFAPKENMKRADFALLGAKIDYKHGTKLPKPAATVESVKATDANTLSVTLSDNTTHEVKLTEALVANVATKVTFTIDKVEYTATVTWVYEAPMVESVMAINATQVEVKFNQAVDAATVFAAGTSGTLKSGVFSFTYLDANVGSTNNVVGDTSTGTLSKDGKTLTITATATKVFEGRYDVKIDGVKDVTGKKVEVYDKKVLDLGKDTAAPTITGTERISANKVKIKFSEPVQAHTPTYTYADGTTVPNVTTTVTAAASEVIVDLSNVNVPVNKEITVTFNGLKDMAGNLVTPQPSTVKIMKEQVDGVVPTISSVTQSGAKTFNIKFNKDLEGFVFTADGTEVDVTGATAVTAIEQVSASEYKVTVDTNLDGATTVTVKAGKAVDFAGQFSATDISKVVTFSQDVVAPKVTASKIVVDKNNAEVLELTFDKDVTAGVVSLEGKQVKNYITTPVPATTSTSVYADGKGTNKKVLHVPLSPAALAVEGAAYDVTVSSSAVTSVAGTKAMDNVKVQFTRGKDGVAPSDVKTALIAGTPIAQDASINNKVTVEFTENVDGATGTNAANYKIDGAVVESAKIIASSPKIVELTLKADSNTFTGVRNVSVENVKAAGSTVAMDKYTGTVTLKENVAPKVEKAVLTTTGSVTLTFSEAVIAGAGTSDFELLIGGKTVATKTVVTSTAAATPGSKTVVFTLENLVSADDIAKGLELKPLSTVSLKDISGNNVFTTGNIKITNN